MTVHPVVDRNAEVAGGFDSPDDVLQQLAAAGYFADERTAQTVYLAKHLAKPIIVEGPAGSGKTSLATALAAVSRAKLLRLQCYEGLDEAKVLYDWNYRKQLLAIEHGFRDRAPDDDSSDGGGVFTESFMLAGPLLAAIRAKTSTVLLIDEVDRIELQTEALLLEVLSEYQVSIPELGTITATTVPLVLLTSNGSRLLSEALRRRCLSLHLDYPAPDREQDILLTQLPGLPQTLADQVGAAVARIRSMPILSSPSIGDTISWARALISISADVLDAGALEQTIEHLLRRRSDVETVREAWSTFDHAGAS